MLGSLDGIPFDNLVWTFLPCDIPSLRVYRFSLALIEYAIACSTGHSCNCVLGRCVNGDL